MSRAIRIIAALLVLTGFPGLASANAKDPPNKTDSISPSYFLIGGSADHVLADFVQLAGGSEAANIAIITHASSVPAETGDEAANAFAALGVKHTTVILPGPKVGLPKDANAVFFCGGDQARLKRLIEEPMLSQLASFEGIIGGTSAGAMVAAPKMIARGMDDATIRGEQLLIVEGLGFLPGCVVDTHVGQRSRDTRSLAALALIPEADLAIGLDEDTAIYVKDGKATIYGEGHVRVFERSEKFKSNIKEVKKGNIASVKGAIMSVYCKGEEFDLPAPKADPANQATTKTATTPTARPDNKSSK